jgi:hypothetical protein
MLNQHSILVEPRSVGWGKMKMDVGMALEPAVVLGLVGIEIVENDMNFFFVAIGVYDAIHQIQELPALAPFVMASLHQAYGGF